MDAQGDHPPNCPNSGGCKGTVETNDTSSGHALSAAKYLSFLKLFRIRRISSDSPQNAFVQNPNLRLRTKSTLF